MKKTVRSERKGGRELTKAKLETLIREKKQAKQIYYIRSKATS